MKAGPLLAILFFCAVTSCTRAYQSHEFFKYYKDKILLLYVKAGCKSPVLNLYRNTTVDTPEPTVADLPDAYRSKLINNLKDTVTAYNAKHIVVEMRKGVDKVVSQAKFDVSRDRSSLTSENWFSPSRLVSTLPFNTGKTGFDYFSIQGYRSKSAYRTFYISFRNDNCTKQRGLMGISETEYDGCDWLSRHTSLYDNRRPVLFYAKSNHTYETSLTLGFAKMFLIYLDVPTARYP